MGGEQRRLWRFSVESAAIVFSILLAFWIDAWWDSVQASSEERILAQTLAEEIDDASLRLAAAMAVHRGVIENARKWVQVDDATPLDTVARLVRDVDDHRTPNLILSTVEAVLSSGVLSSIEDQELRNWIAEWPGVKEDLDEELVAINHFGRLAAPAFFVSIGVPLESAAEATSSRYARSLLRPLLGDTRFLNLYEHARGLSQIFLDEAETVRGVLSHGGEVARRVGR